MPPPLTPLLLPLALAMMLLLLGMLSAQAGSARCGQNTRIYKPPTAL
jgi:hypothetical protein